MTGKTMSWVMDPLTVSGPRLKSNLITKDGTYAQRNGSENRAVPRVNSGVSVVVRLELEGARSRSRLPRVVHFTGTRSGAEGTALAYDVPRAE